MLAKERHTLSFLKRTALPFLVVGHIVAWNARADRDVVAAQPRKPMTITHLFTGADGKIHVETIDAKLTHQTACGELSDVVPVKGLVCKRTPPSYDYAFHSASVRQYVVILSGRAELELRDGTKIPIAPGHILLAEDVTGQGHITRGVGAEDRLSLFVQLADKYAQIKVAFRSSSASNQPECRLHFVSRSARHLAFM
jgi:hypothetical protein